MGRVVVLLLAAQAVFAGPGKDYVDEVHPRSPGTPLEIRFEPWYCQLCVDEKRIEPREVKILMMRQPVEKLVEAIGLEKGWLVVATAHFRILCTLKATWVSVKDSVFLRADLERLKTIFPKLVIGKPPQKTRLDFHQRAHLYHIVVERIYSHFAALTANEQTWLGMPAPYELYLFDDYSEHHALVDRFIGNAHDKAGVQHHDRGKPNFLCFSSAENQVARAHGSGDRIFHNHVVHNVAHNLADGYGNYFRETWAWLEEGLGHYYERRESPRHNTFCWSEGEPPRAFLKSDWRVGVYDLVRRGKDTPFNRWCEKVQPGELAAVENFLSWSIVKWMVETEPIRFTKTLGKVDDYKQSPDCGASLQQAFGVSPNVLYKRWREYVLKNYRRK